ncbi:hypothetical protein WICMUC_003964 [Wickerhamomyces mucosus]|uniref:Elongin-A n=1 Tax=Wickerhamomyces mucosus TaxID=1378264 RepID=A0A9P8TCA0_9ASCO|nr:hypothetical protein WICMUC_003964 [Wickerhamomyces mucosus]
MALGVLPLTTLCENVLLQNHLLIKDLGEIRYDLINRVLVKFNYIQLLKLEELNPQLMLEDEDIWLKLLKKDFPQNIHERFTTDSSKARLFFQFQLKELNYDYSQINIENYLTKFQTSHNNKFKLPSKLLYLKYKQDLNKKEKESIQKLRQHMKSIAQSKDKHQVIHIDEVIPTYKYEKTSILPMRQINPPSNRSKLFLKAKDEAVRHSKFFQNPVQISRVVKPTPQPIKPLTTSPVKPIRQENLIKPTNLPGKKKVKERINVSIFHNRRKKPSNLLAPTSKSLMTPIERKPQINNDTKNNDTKNNEIMNNNNENNNENYNDDNDKQNNVIVKNNLPQPKRIKLSEYLKKSNSSSN